MSKSWEAEKQKNILYYVLFYYHSYYYCLYYFPGWSLQLVLGTNSVMKKHSMALAVRVSSISDELSYFSFSCASQFVARIARISPPFGWGLTKYAHEYAALCKQPPQRRDQLPSCAADALFKQNSSLGCVLALAEAGDVAPASCLSKIKLLESMAKANNVVKHQSFHELSAKLFPNVPPS